MGEFMAYDASQWIYEATLVPLKKGLAAVASKVRRDGVRQLVVVAGLALGVTHIERELPPAQVLAVWESPGTHAYGGNVVPIGHWGTLVDRMQRWAMVESDAKMPDFDSLA
jgi:hypothetical protein